MKYSLLLLALITSTALAQTGGALAPVAAPGLTMKSLDQVEARTPVVDGAHGVSIDATTGTVTITESGSYYLTGNLTVVDGNGINLNSDGITLDLNGYTISSTTAVADYDGIAANGSQIRIFNGHIKSGVTYDSSASGDQFTGSGFGDEIIASFSYEDIHVHDVSVHGCNLRGIYLSSTDSTIVEDCIVKVTGTTGIYAALVKNSTVAHAGGSGIRAEQVEFCIAQSYGGDGIYCDIASNSRGATSSDNAGNKGIKASYMISHCYGSSTRGDGLGANVVYYSYGSSNSDVNTSAGIDAARIVVGSYGYSSGGDGIEAFSVTNSYGNSTGSSSGYSNGIYAEDSVYNSYGRSVNADGIHADSASFSHGYGTSVTGSYGIEADHAIGCRTTGGENITTKYLMP